MSTPAAPHVAVVGGGLAGLAAALTCADAGARVTLFEKRARLGGLTWSFDHAGLTMDNGQHVFLRCCTAYLDFLDRVGSAGDVEIQDRLRVNVLRPGPGPGGPQQAVIWRDRARPPLHLARALARYDFVPLGERLRLGPAVLKLSRQDLGDPGLDQETFAAWLRRHHQGPGAISSLWDLICLPTVNLPAERASSAMAAKVFQTGLLREPSAADIGWSRVPLGLLHGERGAAALRKAGVSVFLNETVHSVVANSATGADGTAGERAGDDPGDAAGKFTVRTAKADLTADAVVVALPHYCTEDVLPPGVLGAKRPSRLASSPIVNVHVHFDRQVTKLSLAASLGTSAQWVFDRTVSSGAERGQYLAVSISAADDYVGTRPGDLAAEVVSALRAIFPDAERANVLSTFVTREHHATFAATPGSAAERAPAETRCPGLVVAGAWTATGWPPTMEGAVRSGAAAAGSVLASVGVRRDVEAPPGTPGRPRAHRPGTYSSRTYKSKTYKEVP